MPAPWAHRYAPRTKTAKSTIIRELLKLTINPDIITLVGGLPAPDVFPGMFSKVLAPGLPAETDCRPSRGHQQTRATQYSAD